MTVVVRHGSGSLIDRRPTRRRLLRGYSAGRQAYDRRRRRARHDGATRAYLAALRSDPCGFCPPHSVLHAQIAADHIDPLEAGGEDHWTNMTAACRVCNASKSNRRLLEWMLARAQRADEHEVSR